jgi:hypothetical protein
MLYYAIFALTFPHHIPPLFSLCVLRFSNRVFIDKAVAVWTGKSDIDHIETVGRYVTLASAGVSRFDASTLRATDITPAVSSRKGGDPLYAVTVLAA